LLNVWFICSSALSLSWFYFLFWRYWLWGHQ
jgi:hypothetical protein